jgi:hypothetical protein
VKYITDQARAIAPKSVFDRSVVILHTIFGLLFAPLVFLQGISTFVLGCLVSITFGLLLYPMSIIWWPFLGFLLASSWLWGKIPFFRLFLILPGTFVAEFAYAYSALIPSMGEWQSRGIKLAICESWPKSIPVFRGKIK